MRLLLDEMYDRAIAEQLRARDHDVVAVTESYALRGLDDRALLEFAAGERRVLLTENASHLVPHVAAMLGDGTETFGLLVTSPASLPRSKKTIGLFVRQLDEFLERHPREDALRGLVAWL